MKSVDKLSLNISAKVCRVSMERPTIIPSLALCALFLAVASSPCLGQAPVAPTNLLVTTVSSNQLQLAWTDLSSNETGFIIERKAADYFRWLAVTQVVQNVTNYMDSGLRAGTWHYYRVSSYNAGGNSVPTEAQGAATSGNGLYLRGSWPGFTRGRTRGVYVNGNYAFVADEVGGVKVIDVSNPASPSLTGTLDTYYAYGVYVSGNYAYVADHSAGLKVIDISNPASPSLIGALDTSGSAYGVYVSGNYAYVADGSAGFNVIGISNPASPTLTGSLDTSGDARGVYVSGNYAYVADWAAGLKVIDISNPASPTLIGSLDTSGNAYSVYVSGNYAFVADYYGGLKVIAISNPAFPTLTGSLDTSGNAYSVYVSGNYAFVATDVAGLKVIGISNPASPTLTGSLDTSGIAEGVYVSGNYAFVTDEWAGLKVIGISNPASPTLMGALDMGWSVGVYVSGNYAYVVDGYTGFKVIAVSNPASPTLIGELDTSGYVWGVYVSGNYAYVADGDAGLKVIDISNPAAPTLTGELDTSGDARGVYVSGNYAFVADEYDGLKVIDISNPAAPTLTGELDTSGYARGVYVSGNYAYVADWIAGGLNVIDISNPTSPTLAGSLDTSGYASSVYVSGNYAFVADWAAGLKVIDISNPASPTLTGELDTSGYVRGVYVSGDYAFVADDDAGLKVIEIRLAPGIHNSVATDITTGSATLNGNLTSTGGAPTTARIYWGPSDGGSNPATWSNVVDFGVLPVGPFSTNTDHLTPNTVYYYRSFASNSAGIAWATSTTNFVTLGDVDSDSDLLPDLWEQLHFGSTNAASGAAGEDPDGDGVSNLLEYLAGTDPTNTASHFIVSASVIGGYPYVSWSSANGRLHRIDVRTNTTEAWTVMTNGIVGDGTIIGRQDVVALGGSRHYRIVMYGDWTTNVIITVNDAIFHTLDTGVSGNGSVDVTDTWCTNNAAVLITATAAANWRFVQWTGNTTGCAIAGNRITAVMDQPRSIVANFATNSVPLSVDNDGGASNITTTSATLNGNLTATGSDSNAAVFIYWGTVNRGTSEEDWEHVESLGVRGVGPFSTNITISLSNRMHYYRCCASNSSGVRWAPASTNFPATQGGTYYNVISVNIVGSIQTNIHAGVFVPFSSPFEDLSYGDPVISTVLGTNVSPNLEIRTWDRASQSFETTIFTNAPAPAHWSSPEIELYLGKGFLARAPVDTTLFVAGEVPGNPTSIVRLFPGWNLVAYPYLVDIAIADLSFIAQATRGASPDNSDQIRIAYTTNDPPAPSSLTNIFWLPVFAESWREVSKTYEAASSLKLGEAFWYLNRSSNIIEWVEAIPYDLDIGAPPVPKPPKISNAPGPGNITAGSAVFTGNLYSEGMYSAGRGANTRVAIYWGIADSSTNASAWSNVVDLGVLPVGPFSTNTYQLTPNTLYYYRAWASNSSGIAWASSTTNFRTLGLHAIISGAGANGTISPSGTVQVAHGGATNFLIQAASNAHIAEVRVDGVSTGWFGPGSNTTAFTFGNVTTNHTIYASFNTAPILRAATTPTSGVAPMMVAFDFRASTDAENNIARCEVDREGDGKPDASYERAGRILVEYAQPGVYTTALRVVDGYGLISAANQTIVIYGAAPTAVIEASPTNGNAPLTVQFSGSNSTCAVGRQIALYEWDFDGDGGYDFHSRNGLAAWTYRTAGTNSAGLRVTDSEGLQDTAAILIAVQPPLLNPPTVSLTALPASGDLPLRVEFTATTSDDGSIVRYDWDFDGDGQRDRVTATNKTGYLYQAVGTHTATVTVVDNDGLSASAGAAVIVTEKQTTWKVWITQPVQATDDVARIWGNAVSVIGHVAPADDTVLVQFQYKPVASGIWTNLGAAVYPQPRAYKTTWDVTGLQNGSNYNLRAVAALGAGLTATSDVYTVMVDSTSNNREDNAGGKQKKTQAGSKDETLEVELHDGTEAIIPQGAVNTNPTVIVEVTGINTNSVNGSADGLASINANRVVSLEGNPDLAKPITITIPYSDTNSDGLVDGTGIPEATLTVHWHDTSAGKWRRSLDAEVNTEANRVKVKSYHLTEFGLFGTLNLLHPAAGGILKSYTSQSGESKAAVNLADGNRNSYWQSGASPTGEQEFAYSFTNYQGAIITEAVLCNYGETGEDRTNYSRDFSLAVSVDGSNYVTLTNGTLPATETPQTFDVASVTCRTVRLVVKSGVSTQAWNMAEFELHGALTTDPDSDGMSDAWEMQHFNGFDRGGTGDFDTEGLNDRLEFQLNGDPTVADTDGDGQSDLREWVAGTSLANSNSLWKIPECRPVGTYLDLVGEEGGQAVTQQLLNVGGLLVQWETATGRIYRVYSTTNLLFGWTNESEPIAGNGSARSYTGAVDNAVHKFFRIGVELAP